MKGSVRKIRHFVGAGTRRQRPPGASHTISFEVEGSSPAGIVESRAKRTKGVGAEGVLLERGEGGEGGRMGIHLFSGKSSARRRIGQSERRGCFVRSVKEGLDCVIAIVGEMLAAVRCRMDKVPRASTDSYREGKELETVQVTVS